MARDHFWAVKIRTYKSWVSVHFRAINITTCEYKYFICQICECVLAQHQDILFESIWRKFELMVNLVIKMVMMILVMVLPFFSTWLGHLILHVWNWIGSCFLDFYSYMYRGTQLCLLMVVKFDHAYEFFVTFLAFKTSFIRTFSVVDIQFCDIIKHWPTLHTLLRSHFYWLGWDYVKFFSH